MPEILLHILKHTLLDGLKTLPFLFVAFFLLELLEHRAGEKISRALAVSGKAGPVIGSLLGCVPQCGFSVFAANLYSGGVITLGTLLAVFLSTSDEALIILLSEPEYSGKILKLLLLKVAIGTAVGYLADLVLRRHPLKKKSVEEFCRAEHCRCGEHEGILRPALRHTAKIFVFLLVFTALLNFAFEFSGTGRLGALLLGGTLFQPLLAALIGLIPNCAASVLLTELYLSGAISFASVLAGLCSASGLGLLALFRANHNAKESLGILGALYAVSAAVGLAAQL